MPNYVTHAVMGNLIDISDSKISLNRNLLGAFSIGHDLLAAESGALNVTHNTNTREFFFTLIKYIKEQKLYDDPNVMAFLYGHIMHYQLDKIAHPYIYYATNEIPKSGIVNFHMASEEYLGEFVLKNNPIISRKELMANIKSVSGINRASKLGFLIDDVYYDVYGYFNSLGTIKRTSLYLKSLENLKSILKIENSPLYYKLIGLEYYLDENDMDYDTLSNIDKEEWRDPISMRRKNDTFLELFDKAMSLSKETINAVNSVIYDGKSISSLELVFPNHSYDTGVSCEIGKPFSKSRYNELKKGIRT